MRPFSDAKLESLIHTVAQNCAISDARHARDYSLCIYLLRMREYYRWQQKLSWSRRLQVDDVGDWVSETEQHWDEIEDNEYKAVRIDGVEFDPFDIVSINAVLTPHDLVYGAGIGRLGQAQFLLARLEHLQQETAQSVYFCGEELARDSVVSAAMCRGNQVFIRREGIHRAIFDLFDDWSLHKKSGPMARIVEHYSLQHDATIENRIETIATDMMPLFVEHERGEVHAASLLSEHYSEHVIEFAATPAEMYLRAARDLLADATHTWAYIVQQGNIRLLDFWLASLNGIRLQLMERSGLLSYLNNGCEKNSLHELRNLREVSAQAWLELCKLYSEHLHRNNGDTKKLPDFAKISADWLDEQSTSLIPSAV